MTMSQMVQVGPCARCRTLIWLPTALYDAARHSPAITFYCAYGHSQHFPAGESEADKLRRERDLLAQRIAQRDDEIARQRQMRETTERQLAATRGVVTRIKNRVGHGVCPCCNRSFGDLSRHMAMKHPTWSAEAAE
jgi:hypothetical protein